MNPEAPRILLIRRDNIGDLVCTTPLFAALRLRFPEAHIAALVTRYSRAVLENHPGVDQVYAYTKAKHLDPGESHAGNYLKRLKLMLALRREHFDYCVLATPGYQSRMLAIARWVGARNVVGFVAPEQRHSRLINQPLPWHFDPTLTETEDVWGLARAFGIEGPPGPLRVVADTAEVARLGPDLERLKAGHRRIVGIHLSARKPSQRWPTGNFAELMRRLQRVHNCAFVLLWAPGDENDPRHPGDDAKADKVKNAAGGLPLLPIPTRQLDKLIAAISMCDDFVCADGGAMHLAAALGKPIVCLFGQSNAVRWRPWGVPYRLLQEPSRNVEDIGVDQAAAAYAALLAELGADIR